MKRPIRRPYLPILLALGLLPHAAVRAEEAAARPRRLDLSRVPGVVIDHLPAATGLYVGSPSIAILPGGDYVASHDLFGPKSTKD